MTYNDILKVIRTQEPNLSFKDAQAKAKEKYRLLVEAQKKIAKDNLNLKEEKPIDELPKVKEVPEIESKEPVIIGAIPFNPVASAKLLPLSSLASAEKQIRQIGVDKNSVNKYCREAMPNGYLVTHGKSGVNTLVTWEDEAGNKIPINGYFKIWI